LRSLLTASLNFAAAVAAGSYLAADYALVCWDAYEVLHAASFVKGSAGDRMERANFFQFRFVPAARDVQAMPLDRGTLELSAYWQQHKVEDVDGWRFVLDWGTPCYDLRPLTTVMLGLAAADLEDRRPAHVDDLEQLLDNLLSVYRAMWGDGETVATMLNNIKGTASLAKDVLKRIGYHPAARHTINVLPKCIYNRAKEVQARP